MAQTFEPAVAAMADELVKAIRAQWNKDKAKLRRPLSEECSIDSILDEQRDTELKVVAITVLPPEGPINGEVTNGAIFDATFPIIVQVQEGDDEAVAWKLLTQAIGLVVDAYLGDVFLNADSDGPLEPMISIGRKGSDGEDVFVEVRIRVQKELI